MIWHLKAFDSANQKNFLIRLIKPTKLSHVFVVLDSTRDYVFYLRHSSKY